MALDPVFVGEHVAEDHPDWRATPIHALKGGARPSVGNGPLDASWRARLHRAECAHASDVPGLREPALTSQLCRRPGLCAQPLRVRAVVRRRAAPHGCGCEQERLRARVLGLYNPLIRQHRE